MASTAASSPAAVADEPFRVMVVDDSAIIRGYFRRALEADPTITVVASAGNGRFAIDKMSHYDIDVIVLDVEMPVMDGLSALPGLLAANPDVRIIMASTLTERNADISLRALAAGAADYIAKPGTPGELHSAPAFRRELIEKVKALGAARRRTALCGEARPAARQARSRGIDAPPPDPTGPIVLRQPSAARPAVLAIGSSTGGPQALMRVIGGLGADFDLPILITQHMPETFTGILAAHLAKTADREAAEGVDGEAVRAGRIYVAPGDFHMIVAQSAAETVIRTVRTAPENFCRPSVDPMLRSLASVYGDRLLTVILTGMGQDGRAGGEAVVEAGGTVLAQDEASSVVWGMPGAVAAAGLCAAVLPLDEIAGHVRELSGRHQA